VNAFQQQQQQCNRQPCSGWPHVAVTPWNEEHFNSSSVQISRLGPRNCVQGLHNIQVFQDPLEWIRGWRWQVSWFTSLPMTRCGATTTTRSQNRTPWTGDKWIPHWRKRCSPHEVKSRALFSGTRMQWFLWISWNLGKPSTLSATLWHWRSWRLKSRVRPEEEASL